MSGRLSAFQNARFPVASHHFGQGYYSPSNVPLIHSVVCVAFKSQFAQPYCHNLGREIAWQEVPSLRQILWDQTYLYADEPNDKMK